MNVFARVDAAPYRALDLHAHALLRDVPLHDVWQVSLPGGGPDRTLADLRALMSLDEVGRAHPLVAGLFHLRGFLGRVFGWDEEPGPTAGARGRPESETLARVPPEVRERSDPAPGTPDPPFFVLYALPRESVGEVRNATVHAFSVMALEPTPDGYRATWAIHVAPTGRLTPFYMALIAPFRRWIVYPAILRHVHHRWVEVYGGATR
ncbi:MAG: DUF2867 domain-containing protein [Myxococcota bacterium]